MSNIDWEFIHKLEGKGHTKGYHPTNNSGVTIASGFDLKEKDADFCRSIGIPETIVSELLPYFGLYGDQAKHFAEKLELTEGAVEIIDRCSRSYYAENLISQYNSYDPIQEFDNLDQGQATVIISVGFQYGSFSRTPSFIKYGRTSSSTFSTFSSVKTKDPSIFVAVVIISALPKYSSVVAVMTTLDL